MPVLALRGVAIVFLLTGVFLILQGSQLEYYGFMGPGPGFFPIWVGAALALASLALLIQGFSRRGAADRFFPSPAAMRRVFGLAFTLAVVWIMLGVLGFRLAVFLFALAVPHMLGRQSLIVVLGVAVVASFGVAYGFETWLRVQLPAPAFAFLKDIGL